MADRTVLDEIAAMSWLTPPRLRLDVTKPAYSPQLLAVDRHGGPFIGLDADIAQAAARAAVEAYGDETDDAFWEAFRAGQRLPNDHVAVQAALATIRYLRGITRAEIDRLSRAAQETPDDR